MICVHVFRKAQCFVGSSILCLAYLAFLKHRCYPVLTRLEAKTNGEKTAQLLWEERGRPESEDAPGSVWALAHCCYLVWGLLENLVSQRLRRELLKLDRGSSLGFYDRWVHVLAVLQSRNFP